MTVLLKDRYTVKVTAKDCRIFIYTDDFALATQNQTLFHVISGLGRGVKICLDRIGDLNLIGHRGRGLVTQFGTWRGLQVCQGRLLKPWRPEAATLGLVS